MKRGFRVREAGGWGDLSVWVWVREAGASPAATLLGQSQEQIIEDRG